jgi:hypothetical protein
VLNFKHFDVLGGCLMHAFFPLCGASSSGCPCPDGGLMTCQRQARKSQRIHATVDGATTSQSLRPVQKMAYLSIDYLWHFEPACGADVAVRSIPGDRRARPGNQEFDLGK